MGQVQILISVVVVVEEDAAGAGRLLVALRGSDRTDVGAAHHGAVAGEAVDVGRGEGRVALAAEVAVAEVIGEEDDDIGLFS